jgi:hypothetical protein
VQIQPPISSSNRRPPLAPARPWRGCMRFLCIIQITDYNIIALGRHSCGAKPLERQLFPISGRYTFPLSILGMQFF